MRPTAAHSLANQAAVQFAYFEKLTQTCASINTALLYQESPMKRIQNVHTDQIVFFIIPSLMTVALKLIILHIHKYPILHEASSTSLTNDVKQISPFY